MSNVGPTNSKDQKDVTSDTPDKVQDITSVTKEIYERNVELAIRNGTLSALRKIYGIINTSLGVEETSKRLIDAIVKEIKLPGGFIALLTEHKRRLKLVAAAVNSPKPDQNLKKLYRTHFHGLEVSMHMLENECVKAVKDKKKKITKNLHSVFSPIIGKEVIDELVKGLQIKSSIIYPIIFGNEVLGVIGIGMDKDVDALSRAEQDMLNELTDVAGIALERATIYSDLKEANHKLKELDSLKDEFVSIASHELRTPMTAIKSYLWMALNQPGQEIKEPLIKYLNVSYASTERLIRLVNDMLTVSRIERNKIELKLAPVDVFEIAKAVYDELKITADERKIHFTLNKAEDIQYMVNADREKLREVFQNIVGNALKFTSADGSIKIQIEKHGNDIQCAVTDTGPGIPKESMGMLFKKFSKIDYSYAKHSNQPGTGLGLYISKQIVSLHKGDIQVQSEVNVGTTFTVVLPSFKNSSEVKKT